ncbi:MULTISPECIES: ABC transporter ATP-binding protein [unclassified Clostridioides]|uniref:ABC transporter ATP-binding protein n=1 Tax=unclassified Clostridioides TaxID=2635829 RepID=UPI001D11E4D4|nr:ABC transporter ATP-binding protein [Clostridioides sp. ES-S-0171-01]MCC0688801.1 ABC transporter ATP-binding protein [Clostridioides sp. ES-S-0056-01]UDN54178.1 ABC transporter ATP-binding protein [Clostridioides sp. ES-S-0054-01]
MTILKVENLNKVYGKNENELHVLKSINLNIEENKFIAVVGASGSGKSTLLNCMAGLDKPTDGKIYYNNEEISNMPDGKLADIRINNFGFVFQNFNLVPVVNVYDNIIMPSLLENKKIDKNYLEKLLERLQIKDKIKKFPNELSGGQQQRVAIARALINKPKIIFADEPTGNLDTKSTKEVMSILRECVNDYNQTLIMITHNDMIAKEADICIKIQDGTIMN